MKKSLQIFLTFCLCTVTFFIHAFPLTEKQPATASAPLDILSNAPDKIFLPTFGDFKDLYLFAIDGTSLTIIDLMTFEEHLTQPDSFETSIAGVALLGNGTSLIVALSNGKLARLELDDEDTFTNTNSDDEDEEDSRVTDITDNMTDPGLTAITTNPNTTAETVYLINSEGYYYEYNFKSADFLEVGFGTTTTTDEDEDEDDDSTTTTAEFTPVDIAYADSSSSDQVLVSTSNGTLLVISPGESSYTEYTLSARDSDESTPSLGKMALTTDHNFALILDTANDFVWVYSVAGGEFIDTTSSGTSLDPVEFDVDEENTGLTDIAIYEDPDSSDDVAYVAGSLGLSLIDAENIDSTSADKLIDTDESTSDVNDPITLSGTPGLVAASSSEDGYIYTANGDASISVLTDNPWVTIGSVSSQTITESSPSFTLTFQSDEAGNYVVKVNSDPSAADGTELISSTTLASADTDETTSSIDINNFDRSVFSEGNNKITVFVTNGTSLTGRDSVYIDVDRPPEPITINSLNFGNKKAYVTFTQSEDNDIDFYTIYAEPASDQSNPNCPGSLTFASSDTITANIEPSTCTSSDCEATISGLTNDVSYCIAITATDESAQSSTISTFGSAITPEATVGPAEFLGETGGCQLNSASRHDSAKIEFFILILFLSPLLLWRCRKKQHFTLLFFLSVFLSSSSLQAKEINSEHFTLETKVGFWIPTRSEVKNFFDPCCNPIGEVEFGYIYKNKFNVILGTGFTYLSGNAIGITNAQPSGDKFNLMLFPVRLDFAFRFDFLPDQLLVPFLRAGIDSVIFRESSDNGTIMGNKFGIHGSAGVALLLDKLGETSSDYEDMINDVYLTFEGRYAHINSFSSTGLDLSGFYPYAGLLFQF